MAQPLCHQKMALVLWLGMLIPASVDVSWNIPYGGYNFKIQYLFAAASALWIGVQGRQAYFNELLDRSKLRARLCFVAMAVSGLTATFLNSMNRHRSIAFSLWMIGTLIGLTTLVAIWSANYPRMVARTVVISVAVQSLVVSIDAFLTMISRGAWHIGKVQIYSYHASQVLGRPHAWYMEPSHFCAFALPALLVARILSRNSGEQTPWRVAGSLTYGLGLVAIVLSTSRMGWIGVGFLVICDIVQTLREPKSQGSRSKLKSIAGAGFAILLVGSFFYSQREVIDGYLTSYLKKPLAEQPRSEREIRAAAGVQTFLDHPILGAGPGAAGAYFIPKYASTSEYFDRLSPETLDRMTRDPLSQNLYTEVLSEWGAIGFLCFFLGLYFLFSSKSGGYSIRVWGVLAIVYLTTQTLARFDVWLVISTLAYL